MTRVVRRRRRNQQQRSRRRWLLYLCVAALVVALLAVAGGAWGLWSFAGFDREELDLAAVTDGEPENYLLIGSDSREGIDSDDPGAAVMVGGGEQPAGRRSDSMEIVRVDPRNNRISLLSVPRDLWVTIPSTGEEQRINTAYSNSVQDVIDTIQSQLGIPIHHFVEIDFRGFQDLIDTVGGVPMYFDNPVRDRNSGLDIKERGCVVLDGYQGLAFARARHLEYKDGDRWVSDPTGDIGRMSRQQALARAAMAKVRNMGLDDVGKVKGLVDAARENVTLDDEIGVSDMLGLTSHFSDMDPDRMQTYSLPVVAHTTSGGAAVVLLDEVAAQPVLDVFRGTVTPTVTTTTAPPVDPEDVVVSVLNGGGKQGEARRVSYVLSEGGFGIGTVDSAPEQVDRTTIYYPFGGKGAAELVAAWLGPEPKLTEDENLAPLTVRIELGSDFTTVAEPDDTEPASGTTGSTAGDSAASGSDAPGSTPGPGGGDGSTGQTSTTTTTTTPGWTPGVAPPGVTCE